MKFATLITLAAVQHAAALTTASKQAPPDPMQVSLPSVPAVANAGKDGFPELPAVGSLLDESSKTLNGIKSEATSLQEEMLRVQAQNEARMNRQKEVFDKKLREQEKKNQAVVVKNSGIARDIMNQKKSNDALLKHALALQKNNEVAREELKELEGRLQSVTKFDVESLAATDDSSAKELKVLVDTDKKVAAKKHEEQPASFISIEETISVENPETHVENSETPVATKKEDANGLIQVLSEGVKKLQQEGKDSEAKLKNLFLQSFQDGAKRHSALLAQQKVLQSTLETMKNYGAKLQVADKHLQETKTKLDERLQKAGVFMKKLSELVLKPSDPAALKVLGSPTVNTPEKVETAETEKAEVA